MTTIETTAAQVDTRLLRIPGSADLALVLLTWPAGEGAMLHAEVLRDLAHRLREFAAVGDISGLVICAASTDREVAELRIEGSAPAETLAELLAVPPMPVVVVLDGVRGPEVAALVRLGAHVVCGSRQGDLPGSARVERIDLSGRALVDFVVQRERAVRA